MMRWTGRLEGLPRFISQAFDLAQAPRKGMGSSLLRHVATNFDAVTSVWRYV